jgi:predicted RNA-binding Zn ribbon-like protein
VFVQKSISILLTLVVAFLMLAPSANAHVVPLTKLNNDVQAAAQARQANIATVQRVLETPQARQLLSTANVDPAKAQSAVTLLNDEDLNRLAQQANQVDRDVAGGLTRGQTSLLILAGVVVVIILVIAAVA